MRWDPHQYARYADERSRPFFDLVERISPDDPPHRVIDLGCGPGTLTATLAERWPSASIEGVDSSPEMIERASALGSPVTFTLAGIGTWQPPGDADIVVSNAALQWVDGHPALLRSWLAALPSGAWMAWQVPGNFGSPSHLQMRALAGEPRWRPLLGDILRHHDSVLEPEGYARLLHDAGWTADVWETTYLHVLPGPDPVVEWVRGTGLRPCWAPSRPTTVPNSRRSTPRSCGRRTRPARPGRCSPSVGSSPSAAARAVIVGYRPRPGRDPSRRRGRRARLLRRPARDARAAQTRRAGRARRLLVLVRAGDAASRCRGPVHAGSQGASGVRRRRPRRAARWVGGGRSPLPGADGEIPGVRRFHIDRPVRQPPRVPVRLSDRGSAGVFGVQDPENAARSTRVRRKRIGSRHAS